MWLTSEEFEVWSPPWLRPVITYLSLNDYKKTLSFQNNQTWVLKVNTKTMIKYPQSNFVKIML